MEEKNVENKYKKILKVLTKNWHNDSTYANELKYIAKIFLGHKFKGVYSYDNIPTIENGESLIFNLDKKGLPGSHWCAQYKKNSKKYIYDSFGRNVIKGKGIVHTDHDKEQKNSEKNCGQRCIAWLIVVDVYGIKNAIKI